MKLSEKNWDGQGRKSGVLIRSSVLPTIKRAQKEELVGMIQAFLYKKMRSNDARLISKFYGVSSRMDFLSTLGKWAGTQLFFSLKNADSRFKKQFVRDCVTIAVGDIDDYYSGKIKKFQMARGVAKSFEEYLAEQKLKGFKTSEGPRVIAFRFLRLMNYAIMEANRLKMNN